MVKKERIKSYHSQIYGCIRGGKDCLISSQPRNGHKRVDKDRFVFSQPRKRS